MPRSLTPIAPIAQGQFVGYAEGLRLTELARRSPQYSDLCDRLRLATTAVDNVLNNEEEYRYTFFQWRATLQPGNYLRQLGPGQLRVARTDFIP